MENMTGFGHDAAASDSNERNVVHLERSLVKSINHLKASIASAESSNSLSADSVLVVLARCLELGEIYGTERAEFKTPVWSREGRLEYAEAGGDEPQHRYRAVVWQVFDGPPAEILDACSAILALVDQIAKRKGIMVNDSSAVVKLMKSSPSITCVMDAFLDARKAETAPPITARVRGSIRKSLRRMAEAVSQVTERRIGERVPVSVSATLNAGTGHQQVTLVDVSTTGAKVRLAGPISDSGDMTVSIPLFGRFPAKAMWRAGRTIGVRFSEKLEEFTQIVGQYGMCQAAHA